MAKQNQKGEQTMATNEQEQTTALSKQQKRELFAAWDAAGKEVDAAEAKVKEAKQAQGALVKMILERVGKGPFAFGAYTNLRPMCRKNEDGSLSYFMRGPGVVRGIETI